MINTCLDLALLCHPIMAFLTISRPKMHSSKVSPWHYMLFSFVAILAMRYASTPSMLPPAEAAEFCQTKDQPNPIASFFPANATGTLNGTTVVIPIPLKLARQLIPAKYGILEHAYRDLLPDFPQGMYPAIVQALHDHEVQAFGYVIPDFTRSGIEFPFVDLLGDNTTSFKWGPSLLMTAGHDIAIKGARDYGINVYPAAFQPACDAYRAVPDAKQPGTTFFGGKGVDSAAAITVQLSSTIEDPFPLSFFRNTSNQPTFADGKTCCNQVRLFNTSVSIAPNTIETVKGTIQAKMFPFDQNQKWQNVHGLRMDTAFIENNYLPCENFRGFGSASE